MEETKITAHLPTLDVEIAHRELPEANAETITLRMTAVPSFEAFADHLTKPGGFPIMSLGPAFMMTPWMNPWANPLLAWTRLTQAAWAPLLKQMAPQVPKQGDDKSDGQSS